VKSNLSSVARDRDCSGFQKFPLSESLSTYFSCRGPSRILSMFAFTAKIRSIKLLLRPFGSFGKNSMPKSHRRCPMEILSANLNLPWSRMALLSFDKISVDCSRLYSISCLCVGSGVLGVGVGCWSYGVVCV
jgi:hypothetical protein